MQIDETEFVALDVETANADMASICQVGIAKYKDGTLVDQICELINPDDYFDPINEGIHGITSNKVEGCRTFDKAIQDYISFIDGLHCVCHTKFDRNAINRAALKYRLQTPQINWLDSSMVVRRAWTEFSKRGYKLSNICDHLGYKFKAHNALEDAKAAAHVMIKACEKMNLSFEDWVKRLNQPIFPYEYKPISKDGNPEGAFFGESIVFTGAMSLPRREVSEIASNLGFTVTSGVTKKTTVLVVGDQDITKLAGYDKSSKHRKAESLIEKGQSIRIIKESDFISLVNG